MKNQKIIIPKEHKLFVSGLIAISIIMLQDLLAIGKLNQFETYSLIAFSIAIPILVFRFIIMLQIEGMPDILFRPSFAKLFNAIAIIGMSATLFGILFALRNVSEIAAFIFVATALYGIMLYIYVHNWANNQRKIKATDDTKSTS